LLAVMGKLSSSENPEPSNAAEQDAPDEEGFIRQSTELTGASEAQARNVYMYSDIIRQQDPYRYRFV
jgi:hypothetical protein